MVNLGKGFHCLCICFNILSVHQKTRVQAFKRSKQCNEKKNIFLDLFMNNKVNASNMLMYQNDKNCIRMHIKARGDIIDRWGILQ